MSKVQVKTLDEKSAKKAGIWSDFQLLVKFRLTSLVLFSAVMSYAIAAGFAFDLGVAATLCIGGFLVTGAANALNQVLEREYDLIMTRTANRPVATGRMSVSTAVLIAGMMSLVGLVMLSAIHPLAGFFGALSLISYAFVYTPLKRSTPLAVAVGAVPGALPLLIGVVAANGSLAHLAFMLFALQFLWQFPHFWAVAWLADDDYKRAGYQLLPSKNGRKDASVGLASFLFCIFLVLNALAGYAYGLYSIWAMIG
ncbi:MAG: protoheme IX farnesyltransferase, partial [Saprospiraceae bacterium]